MDFFTAQDHARSLSRRLVVLYLLAMLAVVFAVTVVLGGTWYWLFVDSRQSGYLFRWVADNPGFLGLIAAGCAGLIGVASLTRVLSLRDGGARVARGLGAAEVSADTQDLMRRRLRNVVEEMAIASGITMPQVFVLEREAGINAFAAGYRSEDATVTVTRGALEQLDRDELQGVIAHEFSHILNGDMRLNIQMMGPLFGIMVIGFIGRSLLRSVGRSRGRSKSSQSRGVAAIVAVGAGFVVVGIVGVWCARLIRAAVSRQREYLADASAVQFTRQTEGIAGALKKIGTLAKGSRLDTADAEEVAHMLFGPGQKFGTRWFATHPPLGERIRRLDPAFTGMPAEAVPSGLQIPEPGHRFALAVSELTGMVSGASVDTRLGVAHLLHRNFPAELYEAAHASRDAPLLMLALVLHRQAQPRAQQLAFLARQLGAERSARIEALAGQLAQIGPQYRLPVLDIAFPAIRNRPEEELRFYRELLQRLIDADGQVELFEYCLGRIVDQGIERGLAPADRVRTSSEPVTSPRFRDDVLMVFAVLAANGHETADDAVLALRSGLEHLQPKLAPTPAVLRELLRLADDWQRRLDTALTRLSRTSGSERRRLVEALYVTASKDAQISVAESELLRAFCAVLDCPLPPLYAAVSSSD